MSRRARHFRSSEDESSPTHHQHEHEATSPESPSHSHSHSPSQDEQDQDYVTDDNASTSRTKVKQEDKTRHHGHCPSCSNRFAFHTGSAHVKCPYCSISISISSLLASSDTSSSSPPSTSKSSSNSNSSSSAAKMQAEQKRFYNILGDFKDHFDKNNSALVWLARASPTRSWKLAIPKACRWPKANAGQGGYALAFRRCGLVLRETDTKSGHWHSWYLDPKKTPLKPLQAALMQRWKESAHFSEQAAELCSMMHGRHNSMNPMVPIPLHDETDFVARDWKHLLGNMDSAKEFNERLMQVRANMRTHFADRSHAMGLEYMKGVTQTQPQQLQHTHTGTTLPSQPINIHHNNQAVAQLAAAATPSTPSALPTTPIPAGPNVSGSASLPTPPSSAAFHPFLNGHNMFPGLMNGAAASLPPHLQAALASASMPASIPPTMINPQHMMTPGWMELLQQQAQAQAQAQQQQQQQQQQAQQQAQQAQSQASVITPGGIARMSSDPSSSLPTNMNMSFPFMSSFDPSNPSSTSSQPSMQQLLMLQQAISQSGNPFPFQQTQTQAPQPTAAASSPSHPMFPFDPSTWLQAGLARATSQPTTAAAQQQSQAQALAMALAAAQAQAAQAQAAQAQAQAQTPTTQDWAAAAAAAFSSAATSTSSAPLLPPNFASFLPPNALALSSLFQSPPPPSASSTNTSFSNNFPSPMTTTATSTTTADPSSSNNSVSSNNTPIPTSRSLEALVNAQAHLVAMASHSHSQSNSPSAAPSNTISESTSSIPTHSHASSFRPMNSHAVPSPLRPNPSPSQSRSTPSPPSSKSIPATTSSRFAPSPVTIPSSMVASHSSSNLSSHSNMTSPATSSSSSPAPLLQSMSATAQ